MTGVSSLPIPYCANSLLYVDFIHGLPKFGGYDSCLVVTCGLTRFICALPCNEKLTGEQTVNILVEPWFEHYEAPRQVHSDKDVRILSDTGWYKGVLDTLKEGGKESGRHKGTTKGEGGKGHLGESARNGHGRQDAHGAGEGHGGR